MAEDLKRPTNRVKDARTSASEGIPTTNSSNDDSEKSAVPHLAWEQVSATESALWTTCRTWLYARQ